MKRLFTFLLVVSMYTISMKAIAGNVDVSPNNPVGGYATLQAAFTAINAGTHGANPLATINASFVEPAAAILGNAGYTTLTIRPTGAFTITGAMADAIIVFDNADNVTIDGRIGGTGTTISLTLNSTDATVSAGCIRMSNGSSNNDIKYVECKGLGSGTTVGGRLINIAQSTSAAGNNDNIIENCIINGGRRGIQTFGTASVVTNDRTIIRNNQVKNASSLGIFIGSESRDNTCNDNEVFMDAGVSIGAGINFRGINCQGVGTNNILRNRIHDLTSTDPSSTYFGILSIPVTLTAPGSNTTTNNFYNNCVTMMTNNECLFEIGMDIDFIDLQYTANVYYNTVKLGGSSSTSVAGQLTEGLLIGNIVPNSVAKVYNNIAINSRTGGDANSLHIGYDLLAYSDSLIAADNLTLLSDYNYVKGVDATAWDAGYGGSIYRNVGGLYLYKAAMCNYNNEGHTAFKSLTFTGTNSCTIAAGAAGGDLYGKTGLPVTTDLFGTTRSATYPYRGAYEGAAMKLLTLTSCLEGYSATTGQITVTLRNAGCGYVSDCTADISALNVGIFPYGDAVSNGVGYRLQVTHYNHLETFSANANVSFTAGAAAYNFTTSQAQAFGSNLTVNPPHCFYGGDVNQDSTIDLSDIVDIFNDASLFAAGCRVFTDVNNDQFVDLSDITIAFNNSSNFVSIASPCPEPTPDPITGNDGPRVSTENKKRVDDIRLNMTKVNN